MLTPLCPTHHRGSKSSCASLPGFDDNTENEVLDDDDDDDQEEGEVIEDTEEEQGFLQ